MVLLSRDLYDTTCVTHSRFSKSKVYESWYIAYLAISGSKRQTTK